MIEPTLAVLADCANVSQEGKINIMGIFEFIRTNKLPVVHPQMQLVIVLRGDSGDANREHQLALELIDEDGRKIFGMEGKMKFGSPPQGQDVRLNQIIQLNNIRFEKAGRYDFKIMINNEVRGSVPLGIIETGSDQQ